MNLKSMFRTKPPKPHNPNELENQISHLTQVIDRLSSNISDFKINQPPINHKPESVVKENNTNTTDREEYYLNLDEENIYLNNKVQALESEITSVKKDLNYFKSKVEQDESLASDEELRERYNQLLDFAFKNIDPFTNIDVLEARFYYENIIKK